MDDQVTDWLIDWISDWSPPNHDCDLVNAWNSGIKTYVLQEWTTEIFHSLGWRVGTCWAILSSFSMCNKVVFPALSRPRNTSLPDFFHRPAEQGHVITPQESTPKFSNMATVLCLSSNASKSAFSMHTIFQSWDWNQFQPSGPSQLKGPLLGLQLQYINNKKPQGKNWHNDKLLICVDKYYSWRPGQ